MTDDIRQLEDRVHRAVDRLKRLHDERDQLQQEIRTLSDRIEGRGDDGAGGQPWKAARAEVVAAVRETIAELRGD